MELLELLRRTTTWFQQQGHTTARLDAEVLLAHVLRLDRLRLYTSFDRPMSTTEVDAYRELVRRRGKGEPVAYLLGEREFYGRPFAVDGRVLIPRPETEELVEKVLKRLASTHPVAEGEPPLPAPLVLDWGTGSGVIAITLLCERPDLRALAVDRSRDALAVARINAERHGVVDRIGFIHSDGFQRVPERFRGTLAALVSNPPYVPWSERQEMKRDVLDFEPHEALFPGPDALLCYRHIAADAPLWLAPGGLLAVEIGLSQGPAVRDLFTAGGLVDAAVEQDLSARDRFVFAGRAA